MLRSFSPNSIEYNRQGRVAAIVQWIHLRLPSCRQGFESKAISTLFSIYIVEIVYCSFELECEKNENIQKEARIGPFHLSIIDKER